MAKPAVEIRGLSKHYEDVVALEDLTLSIEPGCVLGYLGPNGAGKSTTLRLLMGFARPSAGSASIMGFDCQRESVEVHRRVAYVPGESSLWPQLSGSETLELLGQSRGALDRSARSALIERFHLDPSRKVGSYSKGNRQKLLLIAAFMAHADVMLFDEPTDGLDPLMGDVFRACVRESVARGAAVLLSSHVLAEVEEICDEVAILRAGSLIDRGTLAEMRHLRAIEMEIEFDGEPPELGQLAGVKVESMERSRVRLSQVGDVGPLLSVLATASVKQLLSHEPSLEEIFRAHYEAPPELA
jgi:ABC-2 type transport system ATP-binding protein